jgi:hypothetical protein
MWPNYVVYDIGVVRVVFASGYWTFLGSFGSCDMVTTKASRDHRYDWESEAKRVLKAELARAGVSHKVLVSRLEAIGVDDNTAALASRITRGKFSFAFFLQCMSALGVEEVRVAPRQKEG